MKALRFFFFSFPPHESLAGLVCLYHMSGKSGIELASGLVGTWSGHGEGEYPTISPFRYEEEIVFSRPRADKPFLSYSQQTWKAHGARENGMHFESGFLRAFPDRVCELVIAQASGMAEIGKGSIEEAEDGTIKVEVECGGVMRGERNKEPKTEMVVRRFQLKVDVLTYDLLMSTSTTPALSHHLHGELRRNK